MTSLSRACKGCNQLKVRCQPSVADPNACERCLLGSRACVPADKRRRPRDRIAELEAQVAALSKALEKQKISSVSVTSTTISESKEPADVPPKEEYAMVENVYSFGRGSEVLPAGEAALMFLDERVSMDAQREALDIYRLRCQHLVPSLANDTDLASMRRDSPILLFTMVMFSSAPSISSGDLRDQLLREVTCMFAAEIIAQPGERPEIVWALLIACFWFRTRPGGAHTTVHQMAQMSGSLAAQLCTSGPNATRVARLACLASFTASSSLALGIRRLDRNAKWTPKHDSCLKELSAMALPSDELFLHAVRGDWLCYRVAEAVHLCDPAYHWDLSVDTSNRRRIVAEMQTEIDDWTATSCRRTDHKYLLFYRYAAIIHLHEPVLHTPTNKMTFGAPFRSEKMAETDFARPAPDAITGGHVAALYALRDACHALLDLATGDPDVTRFLADSPLPFVAKVFHAVLVLAKLHVAVTGLGNTYGAVLRPEELRLAQYPDKVARLAASCQELNPGAFNGRIFSCCSGMGDWLKSYDMRVNSPSTLSLPNMSLEYNANSTNKTDNTPPSDEQVINMPELFESMGSDSLGPYLTAYDHHGFDLDEVEWQLLDKYLADPTNTANR
ncbi:c6 transcription factor [Ophiostoma piceae UAMH 11346]|uniref:C6 transcription factor n=1 Tax=Ophiostoma piceae (strain UAMH 11346) TaxID=1262450 RepID=S3CFC7_OPHP1|nr:c6 transcription factor [Ophiostoma piceae UAMH 11346]